MLESDGEFGDLCRLYWGATGPYPHLTRARLLELAAELAGEGDSRCWQNLLDEIGRRFGGHERRGRLVVTDELGCVHLLPRHLAPSPKKRAAH
ncbi:hypothetical protein [Roseiterribacter gracilis]|uniref:Uncharacterized protein n=1 Tax=Roseiterribacter gracilis TaxID=2812848 RepID=A0A8S8XCD1_9PROT|nr:hypothetical protein TMPK1_33400 [Rhodospirillales bacterium TMPK1]